MQTEPFLVELLELNLNALAGAESAARRPQFAVDESRRQRQAVALQQVDDHVPDLEACQRFSQAAARAGVETGRFPRRGAPRLELRRVGAPDARAAVRRLADGNERAAER